MKLSIIIPAYNVEKYITTCLESLVCQDLKEEDYEIIIINDGSKDNTLSVINDFIKKNENKNIKIINIDNSGVSIARNKGIAIAQGDYLFFVDSDDYVAFNTLDKVLLDLDKSELDMIFFDIKRVTSNDITVSEYNSDIENVLDGLTYFTTYNVNNGPWHYFINRKFLLNNSLKFYESRLCEDGIFLIDCLSSAQRVAHKPIDIYRYVVRQSSITTTKDKNYMIKMIDDFMFAVDCYNKHYITFRKSGYSKDLIDKLESRRNSYIFFMQARMIKAGIGYKKASSMLDDLSDKYCYPYKRMSKKDYSSKKITMLHNLFNNKIIFLICCQITKIIGIN